MPRRRDAACGRRRSRPAFPGSATGLPGGVWSARWAVPMEEGYIAFWSARRDFCWRKEKFRAPMVCVNATTLSASPWADRSNRSRSAVLSHRLPSRRVRAPSPPRRPAKTPSCAHRSIRHTLGHLLPVGQGRYMWVWQSASFGSGPGGWTPQRSSGGLKTSSFVVAACSLLVFPFSYDDVWGYSYSTSLSGKHDGRDRVRLQGDRLSEWDAGGSDEFQEHQQSVRGELGVGAVPVLRRPPSSRAGSDAL